MTLPPPGAPGPSAERHPTVSHSDEGPAVQSPSTQQSTLDVSNPLSGSRRLDSPALDGRWTGDGSIPDPVMSIKDLNVYYGPNLAVRDVSMGMARSEITALIGPSGCGKSTVLRCLNRMNDLIPGARVEGMVAYHDQDIYSPEVDAIEVRRRIGMVFQKPNPFPKSIYENIAFGPKVNGVRKGLDDIVEESLTKAALWDEVKNKLKQNAYGLSGGQQQRLCIARAIATKPDVILMDEPCSALDPIATAKIEDLMEQLKREYTIVIVTHNMQQAARVSDRTAFFTAEADPETGQRTGLLV